MKSVADNVVDLKQKPGITKLVVETRCDVLCMTSSLSSFSSPSLTGSVSKP